MKYRLITPSYLSYNNPAEVKFERDSAKIRLCDGKLICEMKEHFSTEHDARNAVEPILRAWEIESDIKRIFGELRFEFENSEIIDRSPPETGPLNFTYVGNVCMTVSVGDAASVKLGKGTYPDPPGEFHITPDVTSLWQRFKDHLEGREPLLSMSYFCLTVIQSTAGGRRAAASKYHIDEKVLDKLGELTSTRGDLSIARKALAIPLPQLTANESTWIQCAIKAMILRIGDTRDISALPTITLNDLPPL